MSMAVHGTTHRANDFCSQQPKSCMVALPFLCPLKQYFSHAMIMDGWLKTECNEVMYRSSSNRTLDAVIHIWEH